MKAQHCKTHWGLPGAVFDKPCPYCVPDTEALVQPVESLRPAMVQVSDGLVAMASPWESQKLIGTRLSGLADAKLEAAYAAPGKTATLLAEQKRQVEQISRLRATLKTTYPGMLDFYERRRDFNLDATRSRDVRVDAIQHQFDARRLRRNDARRVMRNRMEMAVREQAPDADIGRLMYMITEAAERYAKSMVENKAPIHEFYGYEPYRMEVDDDDEVQEG